MFFEYLCVHKRVVIQNSVCKEAVTSCKLGFHTKSSYSLQPLKNFNWLIFKREDTRLKDKLLIFDPYRERVMNHKLQQMLNYYDIRTMIEAIHPDLKAVWRLKDDLVDFYDNNTYETAPEALDDLIVKFRESGVPEMIEFAGTLRSWHKEIVNSFIVVKYSYKVDKDTGQVVVSARKLNNGLMLSAEYFYPHLFYFGR